MGSEAVEGNSDVSQEALETQRNATRKAALLAEEQENRKQASYFQRKYNSIPALRIGLIGTIGVGLGFLVWNAVGSVQQVLTYVGLALFLTLGLNPVVHWLESKRKFSRGAAVSTVFGGLLVIGLLLAFLLIPIIAKRAIHFIERLPQDIDALLAAEWLQGIRDHFSGVLNFSTLSHDLTAHLANKETALFVGSEVLTVGKGVAGGVAGALVVIVLTLYFLTSLRGMKRGAYALVPASRRHEFIRVSEQITDSVGKYVLGQVTVALINAVCAFIVLTLVGAPVPVVLATISFFLVLVPVIGAITGAALNTLAAFLVSPTAGLIVLIYSVIYIQLEPYVIAPKIFSKSIDVPAPLVIIAALAGGAIYGILGALVAVPVAASIIIIVEKVVIPRQQKA